MNKELKIDELNEQIIGSINDSVHKFCFGEYQEEEKYPVVFTKTTITINNQEFEFKISCRLHKNKLGLLRHVMITIQNDFKCFTLQ